MNTYKVLENSLKTHELFILYQATYFFTLIGQYFFK
jgi:hypothetical protein